MVIPVATEFNLYDNTRSVTDLVMEVVRRQEEEVRDAGCGLAVGQVLSGATTLTVPATVPSWKENTLRSAAVSAATGRLWTRGRMVYSMHPRMLDELADCSAISLPTRIFEHLPHTDPLVVFPDPPQRPSPQGGVGRLLGFFVFGRDRVTHGLCSTHSPDRGDLGLMFLGVMPGPNGRDQIDMLRVTVPLDGPTLTTAMIVDHTARQFDGPDDPESREFREYMTQTVSMAVNILLYLCTDDADVVAVPDKATRRKGTGKRRGDRRARPPRVTKVGWRLGPALDRLRRRGARAAGAGAAGGREQPPHQRRCHFRTYWTGAGRAVAKLKFVKPYWVRLDLLEGGAVLDTVVRPVRGPRRPTRS